MVARLPERSGQHRAVRHQRDRQRQLQHLAVQQRGCRRSDRRAVGTTDATAAASQWAALDKKILADALFVLLLYARNAFLRGSNVANFYLPPCPPYADVLQVGLAKAR